MDGNGRWAKLKGMPRNEGHRAGVQTAKQIVLAVKELGIPYVSMYTFSKENWKRSEKEVSFLMDLITYHLEKEFDFYIKNKIKIVHIGDRSGLAKKILKAIDRVEVETKDYENPTLLLNLNYSGKYDIIQAVNKIITSGRYNIDENEFSNYLLTSKYPDPDLIIRTSGEFRISNYYLWQSSYSEFFITDKLWPDFTKEDFLKIIENYKSRDRRFGGVKNE
jgi:undecaprenyl diphosphate synthase